MPAPPLTPAPHPASLRAHHSLPNAVLHSIQSTLKPPLREGLKPTLRALLRPPFLEAFACIASFRQDPLSICAPCRFSASLVSFPCALAESQRSRVSSLPPSDDICPRCLVLPRENPSRLPFSIPAFPVSFPCAVAESQRGRVAAPPPPSDAICPRCLVLPQETPNETAVFCQNCAEVFCTTCFKDVRVPFNTQPVLIAHMQQCF